MSLYLGAVLFLSLSAVQLSATGYEHDLKSRRWLNDDEPIGTFNPNLKLPGIEESPDYGTQLWPSKNRPFLRATKNSSYNVVENWPDPSEKLGQLSAVSFDADGNIVVFHRGGRVWDGNSFLPNNVYNQRDLGAITQSTVVVFNTSTGLVVHEWGSNLFYLPHGLTVDLNNNIWLTDVALHQVFKFPPGGGNKPLFTLGVAFVPGVDDDHFCKPTAVAVMSNGDFFVSDGYCNSRIMKYDKDGKLLMQWGRNAFQVAGLTNRELPPYEFAIPHALALAEDKSMLCAADRENGRIQCFNCHNGTFLMQIHSRQMGSRIFSVAYSPAKGGLLFVVNGPEFFGEGRVRGFVVSLERNKPIEEFSPNEKGFSNPHDVAVNNDASQAYVVELNPYKVWKFVNGNINITTIPASTSVSNSTPTAKTITKHADTNLDTVKMVELPMKNNPTNTIATIVGIVIGIVAVIAIVIFAAVLKMRKRGCLLGPSSQHKRWDFPISQVEGFKLGQFLDRHQGFEKVSTEESDDETASNMMDLRQQGTQFA